MQNIIKFNEFTFWKGKSEIVFCKPLKLKTHFNLDVIKAKLYADAIRQLCEGKPMPLLIDLRDFKMTFSIDAAKDLAQNIKLHQLRIFVAFIANNISMRILILSYTRLFEPHVPFKIFNDIESAIKYCEQTKREISNGSI